MIEKIENHDLDTMKVETHNLENMSFEELSRADQIKLMLQCGVHYPHNFCHPRFKVFLFRDEDGSEKRIIDVSITIRQLEKARKLINIALSHGGHALYVGNKPEITEIVKREAKRANQYWSAQRWIGGTLTNFNCTIAKRIQKVEQLTQDSIDAQTYTKDERNAFIKEHSRTARFLTGMMADDESEKKHMLSLPRLVIIVDPVREKTAIKDVLACRRIQKNQNISMIIFGDCCNMDFDWTCLDKDKDVFIPGNDDGLASVELLLHILTNAICSVVHVRANNKAASIESQMIANLDENQKQVDGE